MSQEILCRCGHNEFDHEKKIGHCNVIVDPRDLEEPATYCQCGEFFSIGASQ